MKTLSIIFIACIFSYTTLFAQPDYPTCSNDLFATDTGKYLFISEIKPFGSDRFIELYNCRPVTYSADMIYVSGIYSDALDSFAHVTIQAYHWATFPAPDGLFVADAISVLCRTDTIYKNMDAVSYTLTDSSQSIGLCDWYRAMPPSPGAANICNPTTDIREPFAPSPIKSFAFYDFMGRQIPQPYRLCVARIVYKNGTVVVRKIKGAYDDE